MDTSLSSIFTEFDFCASDSHSCLFPPGHFYHTHFAQPSSKFCEYVTAPKMDFLCFLQVLLSLTQVKHLAISVYKPFTEFPAGRCGTVASFHSKNSLPFSVPDSDLMVMRNIFVACHSVSVSCPFITSDFC